MVQQVSKIIFNLADHECKCGLVVAVAYMKKQSRHRGRGGLVVKAPNLSQLEALRASIQGAPPCVK